MRATLAISLADSIFQTAWIARSVSALVLALVTPAITAFRALPASALFCGLRRVRASGDQLGVVRWANARALQGARHLSDDHVHREPSTFLAVHLEGNAPGLRFVA